LEFLTPSVLTRVHDLNYYKKTNCEIHGDLRLMSPWMCHLTIS